MRVDWIKQNNNKRLLIVALGWGASPEVIENQQLPFDADVLAIYDYKNLEPEQEIPLEKYDEKWLVAWSFGVWASEQLFADQHFSKAIAIGGTPHPINREYGIDPRIFVLTLRGVLTEGVVAFVARMCGKHLKDYIKHHSTRELEDIREELQILSIEAIKPYKPQITWTLGVALGDDRIFPTRACVCWWQNSDTQHVTLNDVPHYPFYREDFLLCMINS